MRYRTRMQDSLPAGGWPLPGGCRTLWTPTKGFDHLHLISSFSGFILARRNVRLAILRHVFLARLDHAGPGRNVLGLGLDEKSALLIDSNGVGRIAAGSAGAAWLVMPQRPATVLAEGLPLTIKDIRIVRLDQNSSVDLKNRHSNRPSAETLDSIERGSSTRVSIASPIMMRSVVPPNEG